MARHQGVDILFEPVRTGPVTAPMGARRTRMLACTSATGTKTTGARMAVARLARD